jgi:hypothetical protein
LIEVMPVPGQHHDSANLTRQQDTGMLIKDFLKIALAVAIVLMGLHQFAQAADADAAPVVVTSAR